MAGARGTMTERRPGVWRLRVVAGYDPRTGNPKQVSRTVKGTKREAQRALAKFVTEVDSDQVAVSASMSLADFLDRWVEHVAASTRSPTTVQGYRYKVKNVVAKLGKVKLSKLTAEQLDKAYAELLNEGLSPVTVHHCHGVLSAALNQAVKWGIVPYAITERASPPPRRTTPKKIPTPETIRGLVTRAEERGQPVLAAAIAIAATTGMRRGELLGLRWTDLDRENGTVTVQRAVKHADGAGWLVGDPKTHQVRAIALDDFTLQVLATHHKRAQESAAQAQVNLLPDGYILTFDPAGQTFMSPDSLTQAFRRLRTRAGVSDITPHTLRHFSASALVAAGEDVRTVSGRLGHADATTTLRVYSHMMPGRDRHAATFLGQLMTGAALGTADKGAPIDAQEPPDAEGPRDFPATG